MLTVPGGRLLEASATQDLAVDQWAGYITGEVVCINGGIYMD